MSKKSIRHKLPFVCQFSVWLKIRRNFPKTVNDVQSFVSELVKELKLTPVTDCYHQFQPGGITYMMILSESHLAVHTWPESEAVHLDLVCCQPISQEQLVQAFNIVLENYNLEIVVILPIYVGFAF